MSEPAGVAVVIPVLGDAAPLAALLRQLHTLTPPPGAVLVVDGSAGSECRRLCAVEGALYLATHPGRGHQLDLGARNVPGAVLWFLHADASVAGSAVADILAATDAGAAGGYFRFRFAGPAAWHKRLLERLINIRARIGTPYGDQGLFVTRAAYEAAGGFPDVPLFEEAPLVKAVRRVGPFVALKTAIGVSPRRWERDGWLRRSVENRLLALAYMAGASPQRLARRYRGHQTPRNARSHRTGP